MYTLFKNVAILKHILYIFPFREIYIFLFCHKHGIVNFDEKTGCAI